MTDRYEPQQIEPKWRQRWKDADLFVTRQEPGRPKFYGLDFFPYPSGAGLSVGHCRNYIPTDVLCRMKYMQGYNVLHPIGFDAFGLPAENEAIRLRVHPAKLIQEYSANYRRQMDLVGISYDWSRAFASSDPTFYKWTQWIFELLYRRGLAYRGTADVNWCPKDRTALANEEVIGGRCERCGTPVEKRKIPQWFFRITEYAQRLLDDLEKLDWPEGIKQQQRNWIGRSEGVEFALTITLRGPEPSAEPKTPSGDPIAIASPKLPLADDELAKLQREVEAEGPVSGDASAEWQRARIEQRLAAATEQFAKGSDQLRDAAQEMDDLGVKIEIKSGVKKPQFRVFTTRIDTIFGVTYCVLAPEHPMVEWIASAVDAERAAAIRAYVAAAQDLTEQDRAVVEREKTGVFTGAYAINPATGDSVPIWIADYVMMGYGTGAIMAVPGHDERDYEFATKFGLPIRQVILDPEFAAADGTLSPDRSVVRDGHSVWVQGHPRPYVAKDGYLIHSGEYSGLSVAAAQEKLAQWMEALGIGERKVNFRLRDWLISRQRFWGCPIPVIYAQDGELQLVPESELPVYLPSVESYSPTEDGSSPLAHIDEFVRVTDRDGRLGRRETDTMGGFACSSWYFLRFCDPHNDEQAWSLDHVKYWMPVDCYVGGAEHAVMHLLYARFWTKVLFDAGLCPVDEPFQTLRNQGQVLGLTPFRKPLPGERLSVGEEGILISREEAERLPPDQVEWRWVRMSKSRGNVVTPDEVVEEFGADALRIHELFVAPFDADVQWSNEGLQGAVRFLNRVFKLVSEHRPDFIANWRERIVSEAMSQRARELRRQTHAAIQKATDDISRFDFNTYIAALMSYLNALTGYVAEGVSEVGDRLALSEAMETLVLLLAPAAPHSADELWERLGFEGFTYRAPWPTADPALLARVRVPVVVQVNGKLRDTIEVSAGATEEEVHSLAVALPKVQAQLEGKTVRRVVFVPDRLINVVTN